MPINNEDFHTSLYDLLRTKGYDPIPLDSKGNTTPFYPEADIFKFSFVKDGKKYGDVWATVDNALKLVLYYDDAVSSSPDDNTSGTPYSDSWPALIKHLKKWAQRRQLSFELKNKDHLVSDMAQREYMKKKERLGEGYYPMGKKASYNDAIPQVKIVIQHTKQIGEGEQRFRNVDRIFVENTEGERFAVPTKKTGLAKVYARHVAEGGTPYDDRGRHLTTLIEEYNKMVGFVRATKSGEFNESVQRVVNAGIDHYQSLRESLGKLTSHRGYHNYFDSWSPVLNEEQSDITEISTLFTKSNLDPRIESCIPILSKLTKLDETKPVKELDSWADEVIRETTSIDLSKEGPTPLMPGAGKNTRTSRERDRERAKALSHYSKELAAHHYGNELNKSDQGMAEGIEQEWEVSFDYGPHQSERINVKASSKEEAIAKVKEQAKKSPMFKNITINWAKPKQQGVAEGASERADRAWNGGVSDEDFIKQFGKSEFDRLTKKYGDGSIPRPKLQPREPTDPRVRLHRGLDGPGAKLKSIIKKVNDQGMAEGLAPGQAAWKKEMIAKGAVSFKRDQHGGGAVDRIIAYDKDGDVVGGFNRKGVAEGSDLDAQAMDIATKLTTGKNLEKLRGMAYDSTVYRALDRYFARHNIPETIYNRVATIVFKRINQQGVAEGFQKGDRVTITKHGPYMDPRNAQGIIHSDLLHGDGTSDAYGTKVPNGPYHKVKTRMGIMHTPVAHLKKQGVAEGAPDMAWHGSNTDMGWYDAYKDQPVRVKVKNHSGLGSNPSGTFNVRSFKKIGPSKAELTITSRTGEMTATVDLDNPETVVTKKYDRVPAMDFYIGNMPSTPRQAFNLFQYKNKQQGVAEGEVVEFSLPKAIQNLALEWVEYTFLEDGPEQKRIENDLSKKGFGIDFSDDGNALLLTHSKTGKEFLVQIPEKMQELAESWDEDSYIERRRARKHGYDTGLEREYMDLEDHERAMAARAAKEKEKTSSKDDKDQGDQIDEGVMDFLKKVGLATAIVGALGLPGAIEMHYLEQTPLVQEIKRRAEQGDEQAKIDLDNLSVTLGSGRTGPTMVLLNRYGFKNVREPKSQEGETYEGLNAQQKAAGQLGPTEKAKNISPVLGSPQHKHPFDGKLVGNESADPDLKRLQTLIKHIR